MRLQIEFVHQRRIPWAGIGALLMSLCWTGSLAKEYWDAKQQHEGLIQRSGELERKLIEKKRTILAEQKSASPITELRQKEIDNINKSLNYSWNQVFSPIEEIEEPGVALLSFNHNQNSAHTQLLMEAIDTQALVRYVNKLNEIDGGNHWYIANYQMQTQSMPNTIKGTILNK